MGELDGGGEFVESFEESSDQIMDEVDFAEFADMPVEIECSYEELVCAEIPEMEETGCDAWDSCEEEFPDMPTEELEPESELVEVPIEEAEIEADIPDMPIDSFDDGVGDECEVMAESELVPEMASEMISDTEAEGELVLEPDSDEGAEIGDEKELSEVLEPPVEAASEADALSEMSAYMNEHNYGAWDYATYSQDPEWQRLNRNLVESDGSGEPLCESVTGEEQAGEAVGVSDRPSAAIDSVSEDAVMPQIEDAPDTAAVEEFEPQPASIEEDDIPSDVPNMPFDSFEEPVYPSVESEVNFEGGFETAPAVDMEGESELDSGVEPASELESELVADEEICAERDEELEQQAGGESVLELDSNADAEIEAAIEPPVEAASEADALSEMSAYMNEHNYGAWDYATYSQDPEWQRLNRNLVESDGSGEIQEVSEIEVDSAADFVEVQDGRVYDDFEMSVLERNSEFYETGSFYEQGINEFGCEQTCGPTSQANALNKLFGSNEFTENDILAVAIENDLCDMSTGRPCDWGGTTTEQFVDLYDKINERTGNTFSTELYEQGNALDAAEVASRLEAGDVVNVAVDSYALWDEPRDYVDSMGVRNEHFYSDHWITVTGVRKDEAGALAGFDIVDSGGGVDYVSLDTYNTICFGTKEHTVLDPTCIVVSKNGLKCASPSEGIDTSRLVLKPEVSGGGLQVTYEEMASFIEKQPESPDANLKQLKEQREFYLDVENYDYVPPDDSSDGYQYVKRR